MPFQFDFLQGGDSMHQTISKSRWRLKGSCSCTEKLIHSESTWFSGLLLRRAQVKAQRYLQKKQQLERGEIPKGSGLMCDQ
ncbi:hypothetical protein NC651_032183 [Populus alba x Populus x berolinensis]|nr:hypothetical protein NC651_032183 [Populus alba x Populus x berolinensis]